LEILEINTTLLLENLKERDHLEDRHGWEVNVKMDRKETGLEGVDWIRLAQDRDQWRAVVNKAMNFGFHKIRGIR
jgi:hypothetical protein